MDNSSDLENWNKVKYFENIQHDLFQLYKLPDESKNARGVDEAIAANPYPAKSILGECPRDTYHNLRMERNKIVHPGVKPMKKACSNIDELNRQYKAKEAEMNDIIAQMVRIKIEIEITKTKNTSLLKEEYPRRAAGVDKTYIH